MTSFRELSLARQAVTADQRRDTSHYYRIALTPEELQPLQAELTLTFY